MHRHALFSLSAVLLFLFLGARARGAEPLWTWVKGGNHILSQTVYRDNGVYGTQGVAASANTPGARAYAATWTDQAGRLWLFGGSVAIKAGQPKNFNDLWRFDPATGNWTWVKGSNTIDQDGVYGTQGVAAPANTPGARSFAVSWSDSAGKLWLFGGYRAYDDGGAWTAEYYNDLWRYDPATGNWTWVKGSNKINRGGIYGTQGVEAPDNTPGARCDSTAWIGKDGRLWLFGGRISNGASLDDLWRFDPATGNWAWIKGSTFPQSGVYGTQGVAAPANTPGANSSAIGGWTDRWGGLWFFGGLGWRNDLWRFDPTTGNWTWVKGSKQVYQLSFHGAAGTEAQANTPGGRYSGVSWTDAWGRFWSYGGYGYGDLFGLSYFMGDLWRFDPITSNWAWFKGNPSKDQPGVYGAQGVADPANTPGTRESAAAWTGKDGRLWLFGGIGHSSDPIHCGYCNDLWSLTIPQNAVDAAVWRGLE